MTNEEVDRILSARVPGGSEVRDWFLPHETDRGLENVRNIVRIIASADRANSSTAWQPIDTAPKDRDVLLFLPNSKPTIAVGFYLEEFGGDLITHWMPLPDAPKVEDGKP